MPPPPTDAPPATPGAEPTDAVPPVGQIIADRYRVLALVGEGGMGAVYLAEHTLMRKRVALKLLHADMGANPEVVARFEREAMAASHIEHPNVAAATDFGRTESGAFFLVLEYVEGTGLRAVMERGPLGFARALRIARQICLALERAHAAGIVHRDLKPENVMLVVRGDEPEFVKVLDFGIAKLSEAASVAGGAVEQPLTKHGTVLGTPEYMAPEQAMGEPVEPRSDLYAIGVMLYEMLTGHHPFSPPDRMAMLSCHIVAPVPKMSERAADVSVPSSAELLVRRLLEKDKGARYANARAVIEAIDGALGSVGSEAAPVQASEPASSQLEAAVSAPTVFARAPERVGLTPAQGPSMMKHLSAALTTRPKWLVTTIALAIPLGAALMVALVLFARRAPHTPTDADDAGLLDLGALIAPRTATDAQRRAASTSGPGALESLAKEFPDDARLLRDAAFAWHARERDADAMRVTGEVASKAPATVQSDAEWMHLVTEAAASAHGDGVDAAFALLGGPLGSAGVDALIDLSASNTSARARARKSLGDATVRKNASKAAAVYLAFDVASKCAAKKDVLAEAQASGDARLLGKLKALKATRGCGFLGLRDCWPCLRGGSALDDAIEAVEARTTSNAAP